jgi:hypothetical protein
MFTPTFFKSQSFEWLFFVLNSSPAQKRKKLISTEKCKMKNLKCKIWINRKSQIS